MELHCFQMTQKTPSKTDRLLEIIGKFIKVAGYRISLYFCTPAEIYFLRKQGLRTVHSGDSGGGVVSRGHRGSVQSIED